MTPLQRQAENAMRCAIMGKDPTTTDVNLFTTFDHSGSGSYVRNVGFWGSRWDWSGVSVYGQFNINGVNSGGADCATLISDKCFFTDNHSSNAPQAGDTVRFVDNANRVYSYTVAAGGAQMFNANGATDIWIGSFTTAPSGTLKRYKVLPANYANYLPRYLSGTVLIGTMHGNPYSLRIGQIATPQGWTDDAFGLVAPDDASLVSWNAFGVGNIEPNLRDSGRPWFLLTPEPIALGAFVNPPDATSLAYNRDAINTKIAALEA